MLLLKAMTNSILMHADIITEISLFCLYFFNFLIFFSQKSLTIVYMLESLTRLVLHDVYFADHKLAGYQVYLIKFNFNVMFT